MDTFAPSIKQKLSMTNEIRPITPADLQKLKAVIEASDLFPSEYLDDMVKDFFNNPNTNEIWLTTIVDGTPMSVACCAPEKMTEGTHNLYLIAVHSSLQGKGIGGALITHIEALLRKQGQRVLIVETSGLPAFERTRKFYHNYHYTQEAVIRDFYQEGEDKVVFWKKLQ